MANTFHQDGYVIVKKVLPAETCKLLSDYARLRAKRKANIRHGDFLPGTHREYGDHLMETLLETFRAKVEEITGLSLWPTLSFYYVYTKGHQLLKHRDRESCEIVAGLCLGADAEFQQQQASWPLMFSVNGVPTPIELEYGDMVIYRGIVTEHWREPFPGTWFVSAIFAYVDKNGPYAYQKFDQRAALGLPHVGMLRWMLGKLWHGLKISKVNL